MTKAWWAWAKTLVLPRAPLPRGSAERETDRPEVEDRPKGDWTGEKDKHAIVRKSKSKWSITA